MKIVTVRRRHTGCQMASKCDLPGEAKEEHPTHWNCRLSVVDLRLSIYNSKLNPTTCPEHFGKLSINPVEGLNTLRQHPVSDKSAKNKPEFGLGIWNLILGIFIRILAFRPIISYLEQNTCLRQDLSCGYCIPYSLNVPGL